MCLVNLSTVEEAEQRGGCCLPSFWKSLHPAGSLRTKTGLTSCRPPPISLLPPWKVIHIDQTSSYYDILILNICAADLNNWCSNDKPHKRDVGQTVPAKQSTSYVTN